MIHEQFIDHLNVVKNFSQAAERYEHAALAQAYATDLVVEKLVALIEEKNNANLFGQLLGPDFPQSILEVGCGTGLLTKKVYQTYSGADYHVTDISAAMLAYCQRQASSWSEQAHKKLSFGLLDANRFEHPQKVDLIVSSLCLQWVDDILDVLTRLYLQSNLLVVSFLLDSSFEAWHQAHDLSGQSCRLQRLINQSCVEDWLAQKKLQGATISSFERFTFVQSFANAIEFPRSLKAIGAHTPQSGSSQTNLRAVLNACSSPFSVNYDIGLLVVA